MERKKLIVRAGIVLVCLIALCLALFIASGTGTRWRAVEAGADESGLPRIDLSIVRKAEPNESVGANQTFDGTRYVVEQTRSFPIGEATLASDSMGCPALAFEVHPDAVADFGSWTKKHVGRSLGVVLDGEFIFVGALHDALKDGFTISGGADCWPQKHVQELLRRCNATGVER